MLNVGKLQFLHSNLLLVLVCLDVDLPGETGGVGTR